MSTYLKAIVAALVSGLGVLATGLDDDVVSSQEYLYAAIAFLTALGAVYVTPNKP